MSNVPVGGLPNRIVSFLPAATEMACALGLTDRLVGISHECDFPPEVNGKPEVVRSALQFDGLSPNEIDARVSERLHTGKSLYRVDEVLLRELDPDLILTQDLCQVCAPSGNEVAQVLKAMPRRPEIVWMTPKSIGGIFDNIRDLARATGTLDEADRLIADLGSRLATIRVRTRRHSYRPRVFCMEWTDPIYCSGHWVPEMVEIAGGIDALGRKGLDSTRIQWGSVREWAPEMLIVSPCGDHLDRAIRRTTALADLPGWTDLPAVRRGRVFAVDSSSYFSRPGPRIVQGVELLAHLIHPNLFSWKAPPTAYAPVGPEPLETQDSS